MALELAGAALGAAFGEILKAILDVKDKTVNFKYILNELERTLNSIRPIVREITELGIPAEEINMFTNRLKEATELIQECAKANFFNKSSYSTKLKEMDASVVKFFQTYVQALQTRDIKKILAEMGLGKQVCGPSAASGSSGDPQLPDVIVGLVKHLQELKNRLLRDVLQVVVLSGLPGSGKTTLATMLYLDVEIMGIFRENSFFITVSETPDLKVIVHNILQDKNFPVPEFQNDDEAINQLEILLKSRRAPILLILDDVWPGSESLIQKFMFPIPGYKILVTSRCEFPTVGSSYKLEVLSDEDAMNLFCRSAFPKGESMNIPEDLVHEVVRACDGLPLALIMLGAALRGQPEVAWRDALEKLSYSNQLFRHLKIIVDCLGEKNNVKDCFLDLGSFPEDQRIPATALIDIWVELYNLDEIRAFDNINQLSTGHYVIPVRTSEDASELHGAYEHFVTLHDVLRDFVIHLSSQEPVEQRERLIMDIRGNDLPKWSIEQMQQPFHARLLSISTDETFSSGWCNILLPEVKVLILNFQTKNYSLPEFMEKMDQLKVLIVTKYGSSPAKLSNSPLLGSLSSLKRIRLENISVSFLSKSTFQFTNLQKLSLIMCEIGDAFTNCTMDMPHMFPNLLEIDMDFCIDLVELPEGLCDIPCLKKLSITKCHALEALPGGFGRLTSLEMLRLHACTNLLGLPESIGSLHELRVLDISDCLNMSELPIGIGGLCRLEKLNMRGGEFHKLPSSVEDLGQLKDVICNTQTSTLWEPFKTHLTNLKINVLDEDIN